jgi:hypothetical protein
MTLPGNRKAITSETIMNKVFSGGPKGLLHRFAVRNNIAGNHRPITAEPIMNKVCTHFVVSSNLVGFLGDGAKAGVSSTMQRGNPIMNKV